MKLCRIGATAAVGLAVVWATACREDGRRARQPGVGNAPAEPAAAAAATPPTAMKTEDEWRRSMPAESYCILRQKATEKPFSGAFWDHHEPGVYRCVGCGTALFKSAAKFDSKTGWPSFFQPVAEDAIKTGRDTGHGMDRTEVLCAHCGGHLGHVFADGPPPTGQRYCINSGALRFEPTKE